MYNNIIDSCNISSGFPPSTESVFILCDIFKPSLVNSSLFSPAAELIITLSWQLKLTVLYKWRWTSSLVCAQKFGVE